MNDPVSATTSPQPATGLFAGIIPDSWRQRLKGNPTVVAPSSSTQSSSLEMGNSDQALVLAEPPVVRLDTSIDLSAAPGPSPLVATPVSQPPDSQHPAAPVIAAEHIQSRLFRLLGDARLESGVDFDTDAVVHKLFLNPQEVEDLCRLLAQPYVDGDKKIAAVIGLGGYGSALAFGVARLLPPFPFGEGEMRPVSFLSMDNNCQEKGGRWRLASYREAGNVLRAKRALIVAPVLTRATCADIQVCVKLVEEGPASK